MFEEISKDMQQLKGIFQTSVSGDSDAEKAAAEKLAADIQDADERRAAGFANNNSKKKQQEAVLAPADPDLFKPDLKGRGHVGGGVYDRGGSIYISEINQENLEIALRLLEQKGWGRQIAVFNPGGAGRNDKVAQVLGAYGFMCVSKKDMGSLREHKEFALELMTAQQRQAYEMSMMAQSMGSGPKLPQ